jgi:hypothetical protein
MNTESLAIIKDIIHCMYLEFAAVAGARIHLPYGKAPVEAFPYDFFQLLPHLKNFVRDILCNRFGDYSCAKYLTEYPYHKSFPEYD